MAVKAVVKEKALDLNSRKVAEKERKDLDLDLGETACHWKTGKRNLLS